MLSGREDVEEGLELVSAGLVVHALRSAVARRSRPRIVVDAGADGDADGAASADRARTTVAELRARIERCTLAQTARLTRVRPEHDGSFFLIEMWCLPGGMRFHATAVTRTRDDTLAALRLLLSQPHALFVVADPSGSVVTVHAFESAYAPAVATVNVYAHLRIDVAGDASYTYRVSDTPQRAEHRRDEFVTRLRDGVADDDVGRFEDMMDWEAGDFRVVIDDDALPALSTPPLSAAAKRVRLFNGPVQPDSSRVGRWTEWESETQWPCHEVYSMEDDVAGDYDVVDASGASDASSSGASDSDRE